MSDATLDASIKEYYSKMTKYSQNPTQSGMILKVNLKENKFVIENQFDDLDSVEKVADELEDQCPRFVILNWKWTKDERVAHSIVLIHYSPRGSPPGTNMVMSRSKQAIIDFFHPNRITEIRDPDDLTDEFLDNILHMK